MGSVLLSVRAFPSLHFFYRDFVCVVEKISQDHVNKFPFVFKGKRGSNSIKKGRVDVGGSRNDLSI